MRRLIAVFTIFIALFFSCKSKQEYHRPTDPTETGRDFIQFALEGKMQDEKQFILPGADNERLFDKIVSDYERTTPEEKDQYRKATIHVFKFSQIDDSTAIMNFENSYKKKRNEIKLVKTNGQWWVDFKYTFTGNLPIE